MAETVCDLDSRLLAFHCHPDWLGQIYIHNGDRNQLPDRHLDQHLIFVAARVAATCSARVVFRRS